MLTYMLASRLPRGEKLARVTHLDDLTGTPSGGTLATVVESFPFTPYRPTRTSFDPLLRLPDGTKSPYAVRNRLSPLPSWTKQGAVGPFVMAMVNVNAVARSNALLGYGPSLEYREGRLGPSTGAMLGQLLELSKALPFFLLPDFIKYSVLPRPGEGPSPQAMERGYLQVTAHGEGERGTKVGARFYLGKDAGYLETARMLVEAGLTLALEPAERLSGGGVLTPASAMGDAFLERLVASGTKLAWMSPEEAAAFL